MLCGRGLLGLRILVLGLVGLVFLCDWPHCDKCKHDIKELDKEACSDSKGARFFYSASCERVVCEQGKAESQLASAGLQRKGILPPENFCSAKECARFGLQRTLCWPNVEMMGYWFAFAFRDGIYENYVDCKRF